MCLGHWSVKYLLVPLGLATGNIVINHNLGSVGKVSKLGLPEHEIVGVRDIIAILES